MAAKEKPFTQNTKADWAKYRKQNPSVKWDENKEGKKVAEKPKATPLGKGGKLSASDIETRRKAGYLQAHPAIKSVEFIKAVHKHLEGASKKKKINEIFGAETIAKETERAKAEKEARRKAAQTGQPYVKSTSPKTPAPEAGTSALDVKKLGASGQRKEYGPKKTYMDMKKLSIAKDDDGVTSGMRRIIRQKHREAKGRTATGLALKSLKRAVAPGTSLGGRYRAVKRAGSAFSKSIPGQAGGLAVKGAGKAWGAWGNTLRAGMSGPLE